MVTTRALPLLGLIALYALTANAQGPRVATLTGRVFSDTTFRPLADVELTLPDLGLASRTDEKGAFRIIDVPPGAHRVVARRIGFASYESLVRFAEGSNVERAIILPRLAPLDTVRVVGDASLPLSFLENRAVGLGHFLTRNDFEKQGNRKLGDILSQVPGLGVVQGRASQGWVLSKRYAVPVRSLTGGRNCRGGSACTTNTPGDPVYYPEEGEKMRGMKAGCYAQVYLDGALLNPGAPATPVDVNEFFSQQLEAVEYYAGPAQVPMRYAKLNSPCGVLVLHTRRSR